MYRLALLALEVIVLFVANSTLATAQVLTLDSILNRIESANPMLKMYDEQVSAVNNNSRMAKSWEPPKLSTGPFQTPYNAFANGMWMITAEQMITNPAKQEANYNYMRAMAPIEQGGRNTKRSEMFTMAKSSYYEWLVLEKKYAVLVQIDSLLSMMAELAQLRYQYNKEKLSNIYRTQAEIAELRSMEIMTQADARMRSIELNTLMNRDKMIVFEIDTSVQPKEYAHQVQDSASLSARRSDLKQLDASVEMLRLQQEYERSKRLPDFGVSLSHMQSLGPMMPNQYSVMGMISLPFAPWSSTEFESVIASLDNSTRSIQYQKQSLVNDAIGKIALLLTQIQYSKKQLANYRENIVPAYTKSYEASMIAYQQNTEELFAVLDGLRMLRMARMSELDQLNALLKLQVSYENEMEIR